MIVQNNSLEGNTKCHRGAHAETLNKDMMMVRSQIRSIIIFLCGCWLNEVKQTDNKSEEVLIITYY